MSAGKPNMIKHLRSGWERALSGELRGLLPSLLLLNFVLMLFTGLGTLRDFPNSADEYACVLSAELFSRGKLSVPSPEPRAFFDFYHVINDGKYYGKYPPGWPAILSLGVLVGVPWLINPLIGVASMLLLHRIARRFFSPGAATMAMLLLTANPFLIFNSASYFSHPACLLATLGMIEGAFGCVDDPADLRSFIVLGLSAAAGFLIRPFSTLAFGLPIGLYLAGMTLRGRFSGPASGRLFVAAGIGMLLLQPFFVYNLRLTGHPFLQPFIVYDPRDTLGFAPGFTGLDVRFRLTILDRGLDLLRWLPATLLPLTLLPLWRAGRPSLREGILIASFLAILAAYFFYWGAGGNQYGPRYLYEGIGAIVLAAAVALDRHRRLAPAILLAMLAANATLFAERTTFHAEQVRGRMTVYDLVQKQGLRNAIVFLRTASGTMPPADLTRNGTRFDGSVLYVHDRGDDNARLLKAFPERDAWRFESGTLTRLPRNSP